MCLASILDIWVPIRIDNHQVSLLHEPQPQPQQHSCSFLVFFPLVFWFLIFKVSTIALCFPIQLPNTPRCRFLFNIHSLSVYKDAPRSPPFLHNAKQLYHSRNYPRQRQPLGCLAAPCICYRSSYRYSLYSYSCSSICFQCVSAGILFRLGDVEILS